MQHFCNHGYIFEKCFSPKFLFAYCWPFLKLYLKSQAQKLTEKMFFVKFMYVTICDLHGHRRSQVMVRKESLYMSSYLCIIVSIGLSGTVTEI